MNTRKKFYLTLFILILALVLYRVLPSSIQGAMPILSICLFAGVMFENKKIAIAIPISVLLLSDLIFFILYKNNLSAINGIYSGQIWNYLFFALLVLFATTMKKISPLKLVGYSISSSMMYFIASNFVVWITHTGFSRPLTFSGLMMCYGDAILFYRNFGLIKGFSFNFILVDLIWTIFLFGTFYVVNKKMERKFLFNIK